MPKNARGNWVSPECAGSLPHRCAHEFDDGGGRPAFCDCDCHKAGEVIPSQSGQVAESSVSLSMFHVVVGKGLDYVCPACVAGRHGECDGSFSAKDEVGQEVRRGCLCYHKHEKVIVLTKKTARLLVHEADLRLLLVGRLPPSLRLFEEKSLTPEERQNLVVEVEVQWTE